jgi:hypothetical protein
MQITRGEPPVPDPEPAPEAVELTLRFHGTAIAE